MWAHLWTKSADAPQEYIELVLCRDIYHCPPDVLERQSITKIYRHLTIMNAEADIDNMKHPKKKKNA
jgi:hypothetical protein